jgi:hypothetical protein
MYCQLDIPLVDARYFNANHSPIHIDSCWFILIHVDSVASLPHVSIGRACHHLATVKGVFFLGIPCWPWVHRDAS